MSLFSVTRYMGEDDDFIDRERNSSETSKILEKIKTEANLRKEKRLSKTNTPSPTKPSKQKSGAKRKFPTSSASSVSTSGSNETSEKEKDEKQKKKSKYDTLISSETNEENNSSYSLTPKKKKLKTKNKHESVEDNDDNVDNKISESETEVDVSVTKPSPGLEEGMEVEDMDESASKSLVDDSREKKDEEAFPVLGNFNKKTVHKVERVLPDWLSNPNIITADVRTTVLPVDEMISHGLDIELVEKLKENGINQFFPVQIQVIPEMLNSLQSGFCLGKAGYRPSDVCVSAPTGSGKTLAFVLPIIQALKTTVVRQVRALIVLPVRDLALQVFKVFQTYSKDTHIKVGLLVGQKMFSMEQHSIVKRGLRGFQSLVDVIVATPGRLVDHINQTEGFNLTFLRFLVIDEADKMMEQIKQDWLLQVENAVYGHSHHRPHPQVLTANSCTKQQIPLQKLLFSATLSQNPEKLQQLNLFQPKLFTSVVKGSDTDLLKPGDVLLDSPSTTSVVSDSLTRSDIKPESKGEFIGKYTTPQGLTEYYVECTASMKPLVVLHMLHNLKFSNMLCFTNSVESTHRLYHLIRLFGGKEVREFSSNLRGSKRTRILQQFAANKVDIIICSDAMSRGMDIEGVKYVISYDLPTVIKTYIHRVGRTARAGKVGTAITLVQNKEFFHFKKMTREAGKSGLKELKISEESLEPIIPSFQDALKELPQVLLDEKLKKKSAG